MIKYDENALKYRAYKQLKISPAIVQFVYIYFQKSKGSVINITATLHYGATPYVMVESMFVAVVAALAATVQH